MPYLAIQFTLSEGGSSGRESFSAQVMPLKELPPWMKGRKPASRKVWYKVFEILGEADRLMGIRGHPQSMRADFEIRTNGKRIYADNSYFFPTGMSGRIIGVDDFVFALCAREIESLGIVRVVRAVGYKEFIGTTYVPKYEKTFGFNPQAYYSKKDGAYRIEGNSSGEVFLLRPIN